MPHRARVQLVAPENRMREMADDHASPNIDVEYVGAVGHVIAQCHLPISAQRWTDQVDPAAVAYSHWVSRVMYEEYGEESELELARCSVD